MTPVMYMTFSCT